MATSAAMSVTASAQQSKSDSDVEFRPHLYGQLQGGIAFTRGETVFTDLLSPAGYLSVGYQFNPTLGLRAVAGGWQGKGNALQPFEVYKFNFLQGNLDLTFSLSSLFGGYKHDRVLDFYGFVGGGALYAFNNGANAVAAAGNQTPLEYLYDTNILPVGRVGVGADIRLTDCLSLTAEGNLNITSDKFNSKKAENPDFQYNALIGLKFSFGKPYTRKAAAPVVPVVPIVEDKTEPVVEEVPVEEPKPVEEEVVIVEPVVVDNPADHNICVFFDLDSDVIRPEENDKIIGLADYLKAHPEYKVTICGYADVQTGNYRINQDLSARRSAAVKARLGEYGIDANRVSSSFKGDTVQPFEENDLNRVVITSIE